MEKPTICRYCGSPVVFTSNSEIYGKEYGNGKCYLCRTCRAFVGVHTGTETPLGTLANEELREYRKQAHFYFDKLWKEPTKIMSRVSAYKWLSETLGIPGKDTHIAMFEKDNCVKTIYYAKEKLKH